METKKEKTVIEIDITDNFEVDESKTSVLSNRKNTTLEYLLKVDGEVIWQSKTTPELWRGSKNPI